MFRSFPSPSLVSAAVALWIAGGTGVVEAGDLGEVSVPAITQWCLARPAAMANVGDSTFQQAEIGQVMLAVGKAGATVGVTEFGVPSVDHVDTVDDKNVSITYCTNIDTPSQPPAGTSISSRTRSALRVVAKSCDSETIDTCEAELVAAVEGDPWKVPKDDAADLTHFVSDVSARGSFEDRVVAAVNDAHSHLYDPNIGLVIVMPVTGPQTTILALGLR
jgi:hypothetical protein